MKTRTPVYALAVVFATVALAWGASPGRGDEDNILSVGRSVSEMARLAQPLASLAAQPGDLILRHGRGWLGPPVTFGLLNDVPHVGVVMDSKKYGFGAIELQKRKVGKDDHGVITSARWDDPKRFQNPGFFSVLKANIPVRYQGEMTTFKNLPPSVEATIRSQVQDRLASDARSERDVGPYKAFGFGRSSQCLDYVVGVYDDALKKVGVEVQRYQGLAAFGNWRPDKAVDLNDKALVPGTLRDWFAVGERAATVLHGDRSRTWTDPSKANDILARVATPSGSTRIASGLREYRMEAGAPGAKTIASTMAGMAGKSNPNRVLIVGNEPKLVEAMRNALPKATQVKEVPYTDSYKATARAFAADTVLIVRPQAVGWSYSSYSSSSGTPRLPNLSTRHPKYAAPLASVPYSPPANLKYTPSQPVIPYTPPPTFKYTPPPTFKYTSPPTFKYTSPPTFKYTPPPTFKYTPPPTFKYTPPPTFKYTPPVVIPYTPPPTFRKR